MQFHGRSVLVVDGYLDKALKKFKKKITDSGLLLELMNRQTYTKPTTRRKKSRDLAQKRWKKYLQTQQLPPRKY